MPIQWYPGHMKVARRTIVESLSSTDVLIELLDARMPASSTNPVLGELRRDKPCIKLLNKSDLADPEVTRAWMQSYESSKVPSTVLATALTNDRAADTRAKIAELCKRLAPHRNSRSKNVRVMVVGIPNVGKSTLINTLMERKVAKVGDEPAVTKVTQFVTLSNGMTLVDNAGILWPRMDEAATLRLALGGAIPDVAIDYESVAVFCAEFLRLRYPSSLRERFKLAELPLSANEVLIAIGQKHGGLRRGGGVDLHKASDILVHEFRAGKLGRISLEAPGDEHEVVAASTE